MANEGAAKVCECAWLVLFLAFAAGAGCAALVVVGCWCCRLLLLLLLFFVVASGGGGGGLLLLLLLACLLACCLPLSALLLAVRWCLRLLRHPPEAVEPLSLVDPDPPLSGPVLGPVRAPCGHGPGRRRPTAALLAELGHLRRASAPVMGGPDEGWRHSALEPPPHSPVGWGRGGRTEAGGSSGRRRTLALSRRTRPRLAVAPTLSGWVEPRLRSRPDAQARHMPSPTATSYGSSVARATLCVTCKGAQQ